MQTKQKWALTLLTAWGAMSCGGSAGPVDAYQGAIDPSALDAKFQPFSACGRDGRQRCYTPAKAFSGGVEQSFYNLGLVEKAKLTEDAQKRPTLKASAVTARAYDFPEACTAGKAFDERTDAYRQDAQFAVFDALPLTPATNAPAALPLVRTSAWTGVTPFDCNAIKSAQSLKDGVFGGEASADESLALRAVIDLSVLPTRPSAQAASGWYLGLQLAYLDGGAVAVTEEGNVRTMDGVWFKGSSGTPRDLTARLVFQARPGEPDFSPVVRLREVAGGSTTYTSLCYAAPCAADAYDLSANATYTGMLFLVPSTP
ncbi:hypothetical protein [Melittangium boletus]|uniref:hypothetical protein n=1 Tax=Melittangium boletus TaxID=83453 RepID=UPI003DA324EA